MHTSVIIPAAGTGKRFNTNVPKQFTLLDGIPILIHTLKLFNDNPNIHSIIIAASQEQFELIESLIISYAIDKVKHIVAGGSERHLSVQAALETPTAKEADVILVHDAVRPFASNELIVAIINYAIEFGAAIPVVSPKDTIKQLSKNNTVLSTLNRSELGAAQTPQGFRREVIMNAYQFAHVHSLVTTDDSSVVELSGGIVHTIDGEENNIKITTQLDFVLAQTIVQNLSKHSISE